MGRSKFSITEISCCHKSLSENCYLGPLRVLDVLVDGEDEEEDKEEAGTTKEVPDVVPDIKKTAAGKFFNKIANSTICSPVIEFEQLARSVQFPRFRWRHIRVFLFHDKEVECRHATDGTTNCKKRK